MNIVSHICFQTVHILVILSAGYLSKFTVGGDIFARWIIVFLVFYAVIWGPGIILYAICIGILQPSQEPNTPVVHSTIPEPLATYINIHASTIATFKQSKMAYIENKQNYIPRAGIKVEPLAKGTNGCYYPPTQCITISAQANQKDIVDIIIHETAHHIDCKIRGMTCHDSFWQKIYEACGGKNGDYLKSHGL